MRSTPDVVGRPGDRAEDLTVPKGSHGSPVTTMAWSHWIVAGLDPSRARSSTIGW